MSIHYFVRKRDALPCLGLVTREEYIEAERAEGFRSEETPEGEPTTGLFVGVTQIGFLANMPEGWMPS